jgi:hypothetical protein
MMKFKLNYSDEAKGQFLELENSKDKVKQYKAVAKTLGLMQTNLRHPSLHTHLMLLSLLLVQKCLNLTLRIKHLEPTEYFGVMGQGAVNYILLPSRHIHKNTSFMIKEMVFFCEVLMIFQ